MLYVCEEHLEIAMDEIVDDYEKAPELLTLEQAGLADERPARVCGYCEQPAQYTVE